ncbi:MAG: threonylcarbamoyl-AMP synthase [Candidatus Margulisbacteria bacterium GWF2_35_9]|nr:MAG: threonylcarbamoyl-AMP synthase [Candidatus Margulisbacteria bacterium GWF2_35_9]
MDHIKEAIKALSAGEVIAIPTDTVYGLAVDADNEKAIDKLNRIKFRDPNKNYVLQVDSVETISGLVSKVSKPIKNILNKFWPGEITFIFHKNTSCNYSFLENTIAIRIPNHKLTLDLLKRYKKPLIVTSMNISGEPAILDYKLIPDIMQKHLAYVIPCNTISSNIASTIVNLSLTPPQVLRKGAMRFKYLLQ